MALMRMLISGIINLICFYHSPLQHRGDIGRHVGVDGGHQLLYEHLLPQVMDGQALVCHPGHLWMGEVGAENITMLTLV